MGGIYQDVMEVTFASVVLHLVVCLEEEALADVPANRRRSVLKPTGWPEDCGHDKRTFTTRFDTISCTAVHQVV